MKEQAQIVYRVLVIAILVAILFMVSLLIKNAKRTNPMGVGSSDNPTFRLG